MRKILLPLLLSLPFLANAQTTSHHEEPPPPSDITVDNSQGWSYGGYKEHFAVSALFGVVGAAQIFPHEPVKAFAFAMVPGVLKEVVDSRQKGNYFSGKDLAADALGAAFGVWAGGAMLSYSERDKTVKVSYSTKF